MLIVHLARKPLSESSVAANVLAHGTGAINVDAVRVHSGPSTGGSRSGENAFGQGAGWNKTNVYVQDIDRSMSSGRWPANLILAHRPGCRRVGTRHVQSDGHYPKTRGTGSQVSGPSGHRGQADLAEHYTKGEVVAAWDCEPGCPVADLDAQSGNVRSSGIYPGRAASGDSNWFGDATSNENALYDDKGGASRFFKQVGGGE